MSNPLAAMRRLLLIVAALGLCGLSCASQPREQNYNLEKTSPNGAYRIKVDVKVEREDSLLGFFKEWGKVQCFKGRDVIYANEWNRTDNFEPTFMEAYPVIEWVSDNAVRQGQDRSDQPFLDEVAISNQTDESLKYVGFSYGKYETFTVLDLAPGGRISLSISPRFKPDGTSNFMLTYGGETQSGREVGGTLEQKQRESPADGPLKFQIEIN